MNEVKFKKTLEFNGYEFLFYNELAEFLINNFEASLRLINNNSLFELLEEGDSYLAISIKEAVKDFKHQENIITYIIYKLSSSSKFVTKSHNFKTTYEIAVEMKRTYPHINSEIMTLLSDNILSKIYLDEYNFTKNPSDKRTHDFMLHVEENIEYTYSYYYFLLLHLSSNEIISFIINNVTFTSLEELTSYMYTNQRYIKDILTEVKSNNYVLALIATKTNINSLTTACLSDNYLDLLCLLQGFAQYDCRNLLTKKMSYWLLDNYQNYTYSCTRAKKIYTEYSLIVKKEDMSFIEMFEQVKKLENLYNRFILLYKSDRIVERVNFIHPLSEQYHLGYIYNNDYVCSKYLVDNELSDINIYSEDYILGQEKQIVYNELDNSVKKLGKADDLLNSYYEQFDIDRYKDISTRYCLMMSLLLPILLGLMFHFGYNISKVELIFLYVFSIPALILLLGSLMFITPEYNILLDIQKRKKKYNKYLDKINKLKVDIARLQYYKHSSEDGETNNAIVYKKINLDFTHKFDKFYNESVKINKKTNKLKQYDKKILNIITIAIAFPASLSFVNHIIFDLLNKELTYLILTSFPILYLVFIVINLFVLTREKIYRNTLFVYIISLIITIIVNFY